MGLALGGSLVTWPTNIMILLRKEKFIDCLRVSLFRTASDLYENVILINVPL